MRDNNDHSLEDRIEHLEQLVEKLQYTIERMQDRMASTAPSRPSIQRPHRQPHAPATNRGAGGHQSIPPQLSVSPPEPMQVPSKPTRKRRRPLYALDSEAWLSRIGFSMFFLGVALALNYAFDQVWFGPEAKVLSGCFLGLLFVAFGLHFHKKRPRFGQVLLGGGIATFYLIGYAAFQVYSLVPYSIAFVGMLIITVLSFLLAVHRDDSVLAILATLGGLVTPFIMHAQGEHLLVLVSYTSLILIGAGAMYWFRGWRSLLFVSAIGGGLVLVFCYFYFGFSTQSIASERWTLQVGTLIAWALFWLMPVLRGILRASNPDKYPAPPHVKAVGYFFNHPALPLSVTTPLATLITSMSIWDLSDDLWGWIILLSSAIYGLLYLIIRGKKRDDLNHLAQMQGLTATIFLTIGLFLLYNSHSLLVALAAEAALIRVVARTMNDRLFSVTSHTLFLGIAIWIIDRLINFIPVEPPLLNLPALCEFMVIVLIAAMAGSIRTRWVATAYLVAAHVLFLGWIFRELNGASDGQALITASWGIYSIGLFIVSFWKNYRMLRITALFTMGLVVFKLFLADLDQVEPLLRVVLFLGFGILFMMLSYLVPRLFRRSTDGGNTTTVSPKAEPEIEKEPSL